MFKKIIVAAVFVMANSAVSAADIKIGVVDMKAVESKSPQLKTIGEKLQQKFKDQQDELLGKKKKYDESCAKVKKEEMTMTFAQKIKLSRELQELEAELKMKKAFLDDDIQMEQKRELQKIRIRIQQAVQKVAADGKFDLILYKQGTLYAGPAVDITDKVIAIISNPAG